MKSWLRTQKKCQVSAATVKDILFEDFGEVFSVQTIPNKMRAVVPKEVRDRDDLEFIQSLEKVTTNVVNELSEDVCKWQR